MARRGYVGFTINLIPRHDGNPKNVLIWAGGGMEAIISERLYRDLNQILDQATEENHFLHWQEIWEKVQ